MKQNQEQMYVFLSIIAVSIVVFAVMVTVLFIDTVGVIVKQELNSKYEIGYCQCHCQYHVVTDIVKDSVIIATNIL